MEWTLTEIRFNKDISKGQSVDKILTINLNISKSIRQFFAVTEEAHRSVLQKLRTVRQIPAWKSLLYFSINADFR